MIGRSAERRACTMTAYLPRNVTQGPECGRAVPPNCSFCLRIPDYLRVSTAGGHALQMELRHHVLEHDGDVDVAGARVDGEQVRIEAHGNLAELRASGLLKQDNTVRVAGRGPAGRHDDPSARVDGDALRG